MLGVHTQIRIELVWPCICCKELLRWFQGSDQVKTIALLECVLYKKGWRSLWWGVWASWEEKVNVFPSVVEFRGWEGLAPAGTVKLESSSPAQGSQITSLGYRLKIWVDWVIRLTWGNTGICVGQNYFLKPSHPDWKGSPWISNPFLVDTDGVCRLCDACNANEYFPPRILHFTPPSS